MNKNVAIGGGVVVVLILALVFAFSGGDTPPIDGYAFGDVSVSGDELPRHESGTDDPAVGMSAPLISGADDNGTPITIGEPGSASIVMFLAHWCSHCQREVPDVTAYLAANDPGDVVFSAVATGSDATAPNFPPSVWLERENWPVETIYDDSENTAATAYGLSAFPFWVVLDGDGVVQSRFTGELTEDELAAIVEFATDLDG